MACSSFPSSFSLLSASCFSPLHLILHSPASFPPSLLSSVPRLISDPKPSTSFTHTHMQEKDRNLRRITRMVLVVVAVFIVCWTPIHIFVIITALINIPSSTLQTITWHFCIALGYTNRYTPGSSLRQIHSLH